MLSKKSIWTKDIIGLTQITNLNEKKINCKSLKSGYSIPLEGNLWGPCMVLAKDFPGEKSVWEKRDWNQSLPLRLLHLQPGLLQGPQPLLHLCKVIAFQENKKKVIYELRTRVLDELLKWAYTPSQLKPPSASDLRNLGPYRHQHLSPVNDQAALKGFFSFSIHIFFSRASELRKAERNQHTKFFLYFVVQIWKSSSSPGKSRSISQLSYFPPIWGKQLRSG